MCNVENFSALWKEMLKIRKSISCLSLQTLSKCCGCKLLCFTFLGYVFRCDFALYIIVYKLKAELAGINPQFCTFFLLNCYFLSVSVRSDLTDTTRYTPYATLMNTMKAHEPILCPKVSAASSEKTLSELKIP